MTKLILITGKAGVGKTTIGRNLAHKLCFTFLETSTITKGLVDELARVKGIADDDRDSEKYLNEIRPFENEAYLNTIVKNLELEIPVVTAKVWEHEFTTNEWFQNFIKENNLENVDVYVISLYVESEDFRKQRILKRGHPKDAWKLNNWEEYSDRIKGYSVDWEGEHVHHMKLNTTKSDTNEDVNKIIEFIYCAEVNK